jgi:osmotically-inducible protein OsmY
VRRDDRDRLSHAHVSDVRLEQSVRRGLLIDPRAGDGHEVAITVDRGFVSLSGTVDSFQQKRAIGKVAASVAGVAGVANALRIRCSTADVRIHDRTLRAAVRQALLWNSAVPDDNIRVDVSNGQVLLTGDVDFGYEADAAYETVADMIGVLGVTIGIRVTSVARDAGCLLDRVSAALRHAHGPLIAGISVCAWRGEVTLRGNTVIARGTRRGAHHSLGGARDCLGAGPPGDRRAPKRSVS